MVLQTGAAVPVLIAVVAPLARGAVVVLARVPPELLVAQQAIQLGARPQQPRRPRKRRRSGAALEPLQRESAEHANVLMQPRRTRIVARGCRKFFFHTSIYC